MTPRTLRKRNMTTAPTYKKVLDEINKLNQQLEAWL